MRIRLGLVLLALSDFTAFAINASTIDALEFEWDVVSPTPYLQYHKCYETFMCARLQLPLDWLNDTDDRVVAIAIIKLTALVSEDHPSFGGSIFTNPGGPGGSGVDFMRQGGHLLRDLVDKPSERHYEIISFDPRGIFNSWPVANCFPNSILNRDAFAFESRGNGGIEIGPAALAYAFALNDALSRRCEAVDHGANPNVMAYMGTASVARDMVAMVDEVEKLRKRTVEHLDSSHLIDEKQYRLGLHNLDGVNKDQIDLPRLQYIGFSYGTILGNYFASMFPGRVSRVVLDGVCDADDYANGPLSYPRYCSGLLTNVSGIVDADEIIDSFFHGCYGAGPSRCDLARDQDTSVAELRSRFWTWLERVKGEPLNAITPHGTIVIITAADIRLLFGLALYNPITDFKLLASAFNRAMNGDTTDLVSRMLECGMVPSLHDAYLSLNGSVSSSFRPEGQAAILCGDGDNITGHDLFWWRRYINEQLSNSSVLGAWWATIRFACSGWRFRPNWSFKGPFTTPEASKSASSPVPGRPAAPLLFLSNRLDPVTPLSAARAMAKNHPGAGVVVQEAMGHCAFATAQSPCTKKAVADYFDSGVVPSREVSCATTCGPWDDGCQPFVASSNVSRFEGRWLHRKVDSPLGVYLGSYIT